MEQNVAFERCVDFMARMIEKYGKELLEEIKVGVPRIISGRGLTPLLPRRAKCREARRQSS